MLRNTKPGACLIAASLIPSFTNGRLEERDFQRTSGGTPDLYDDLVGDRHIVLQDRPDINFLEFVPPATTLTGCGRADNAVPCVASVRVNDVLCGLLTELQLDFFT